MEQRTVSSNEHTQNIRAGLAVLKTNYGFTIDEYDYLDIAVDVLRDIRYLGSTDYLAFKKVDSSGHISIPCNLGTIVAITTVTMAKEVFSDRIIQENEDDSAYPDDDHLKRQAIATAIGFGKTPGIDKPGSTGYIPYSIDSLHKRIYVGNKYAHHSVGLAYTGTTTDLDGFPMITRKQANAIAAVCAKILCMRGANRGDKHLIGLIELYVGVSARLVQAASMPESINDNDIDELLNCKTSFNRKSINRPSKYSR
jgi:hypothetical protein